MSEGAPPHVPSEPEPITAVLGRLAPVEVEAFSVAGCDRWLADAARVAGWLTVMRLDVEQARAHRAWAGPVPADDVAASTYDDVADRSAPVPEPQPHPAPEPDKPGRRSTRAAARDAKIDRGLTLLPSFRSVLEHGELTPEHVLALNAVRNRNLARQHEPVMLAAALERTAEEFAAWLRVWDAEIDLGLGVDVAARQHAARSLRLFDGPNQMGELRATLEPALFDSLKRTLLGIDAELRRLPGCDHTTTFDQRMADAFEELLHRANGAVSSSESLRTAVVVLIDLDDLLEGTGNGVSIDGTPIDVGEVRRMAATGHVIPAVLNADSLPLDLGRAQRYATDAQWLALMIRDGGCVLCDAPLGTLDAHHCPDWCQGGTTDLCRMCILCTRCHRKVHAEKIILTVIDGRVHATTRTGLRIPTNNRTTRHPPARAPAGAPTGPLPDPSPREHRPAA